MTSARLVGRGLAACVTLYISPKEMGELVQLMQSYLRGASSMDECADWLAGVDWDDPELTKGDMETVGGFVLVLTEISEGLREEAEFRQDAANFVAAKSDGDSKAVVPERIAR